MSRWAWIIGEWTDRLWFRAGAYGVAAVLTALISIWARRFIPADIPQKIGADAVDSILNILASSMLAVTIFSVSTMVSAYSAATSNVTPRATQILIEDKFSQNALSTFIGTFIFSIVGIIALKTGAYGDSGRLVLFVVTILIIALIIITLMRWIDYLSKLGRVGHTIQQVEKAVEAAMRERMDDPYLGGRPMPRDGYMMTSRIDVYPHEVAYIRHIDMKFLSDIAETHKGKIFIHAVPGKLTDPAQPLASVIGIHDQSTRDKIRDGFITGKERSFRQDPRFGLAVLSEIAIRALSPAINDPGTAILCLSCGLRLLLLWPRRAVRLEESDSVYPSVYVPALQIKDLFEDFYAPIARDGAGNLEVGMRIQKSFKTLWDSGDPDLKQSAADHSRRSLERSLSQLIPSEQEKLMKIARFSQPD